MRKNVQNVGVFVYIKSEEEMKKQSWFYCCLIKHI